MACDFQTTVRKMSAMRMTMRWCFGVGVLVLASCSSQPPPDRTPLRADCFRYVAERRAAVVISDRHLTHWTHATRALQDAPDNADGGSATPITPDGYFLTAAHVLANADGRHVQVIYDGADGTKAAEARIVWRSAGDDLALLHAPMETRRYYTWTPPDQRIPAGTPVVQGGIITGMKTLDGKLVDPLSPESPFSHSRRFKHSIPLKPGDSGGAVIDAKGRLLGVNSAVEFLIPMETAYFIGAEGCRPNTIFISDLINHDRATTMRAPRP
jgi:S1-C subfamily serine protease